MTSGNGEFYVKAGVRLPVFVRGGWKAVYCVPDQLMASPSTTCSLSNLRRTLSPVPLSPARRVSASRNKKGSNVKTGLSLFWRVLITQLVFSLLVALLLASSPLNGDISLTRIKPTIVQVSFALVLWLSVQFSKNGLVHLVWGRRLGLGMSSWRSFTKMLAVLMFLLGCTNLAAIYFLTMKQWLIFKTAVPLPIEIIFCLTVPPILNMKLAESLQVHRGA